MKQPLEKRNLWTMKAHMNFWWLTFFMVVIPQLVNAQLSPFIGTWITPSNESITIRDTTNKNGSGTSLYNGKEDKSFYIMRYADTLSFQFKYYRSSTDFKILYCDRYDFRIIDHSNRAVTLEPVSDFSKKFFADKHRITFVNQTFAADTGIHLEKIIYHTTSCYGWCPIFHLEIGQDTTMKLHREKSASFMPEDEKRIGYFRDTMTSQEYKRLVDNVQSINLKTLELDGPLCCDGSVVTLIIYYNNGQRKYFQSMSQPPVLYSLLDQLRKICENFDVSKTSALFEIEQ